MRDTATLRVTRLKHGRRDRFRRYLIILDGAEVARLKRGDALESPLSPGPHTIRVRIDWGGSETHDFVAIAGSNVVFECEPSGPSSQGLGTALNDPSGYVTLRRVADGVRRVENRM